MERSFLEGLQIEGGTAIDKATIDVIMAEHNKSILQRENDLKTYKTKAESYDSLSADLNETKKKLGEYVQKEKQQQFHDKLKGMNVKEDRIVAFATLLGKDTTDEAITNLKTQYPEWVVEVPTDGTIDFITPPAQPPTPQIVVGGNPSGGAGEGSYKAPDLNAHRIIKRR